MAGTSDTANTLNVLNTNINSAWSTLNKILVFACEDAVKNDREAGFDIASPAYTNAVIMKLLPIYRFLPKPTPPSETDRPLLELTCDMAKPQYPPTPFENEIFAVTLRKLNIVDTRDSPSDFPEYEPIINYFWKYKELKHLYIDIRNKLKAGAFLRAPFVTIHIKSVGSLGKSGCFEGCRRLTTVDLSETELSNIPPNTFRHCRVLREVLFPTSQAFRRINENAFTDCPLLKSVNFDPIVYIAPNAFDNGVVLPEKPYYIPKIQIGERILDRETRLFGLYTVPIFDPNHSDVLFFAENIRLCLQATSNHTGQEWYLHIFETQKNLKLVTSPRNFREVLYGEDESEDDEEDDSDDDDSTAEHIRVEKKLRQLCLQYKYDGWYQRLQMDNYESAELKTSLYETALLQEAVRNGAIKQIASAEVYRDEIRFATRAVVTKDNFVAIKKGHTVLKKLPNILSARNKPNSASGHASKRQRTQEVSLDNTAISFEKLRL